MKAYIEEPNPLTRGIRNRPIWIPVDEDVQSIQLRDTKGKLIKTITHKTVRCNICIVDCQRPQDGQVIAKLILKAIEDYHGT